MENLLIILGLVLLSALSSWLKQRGHKGDEPEVEDAPPTPDRPARHRPAPSSKPPLRPAPAWDWEEELRRWLGGQTSAPESTPVPPSVPGAQEPAPAGSRPTWIDTQRPPEVSASRPLPAATPPVLPTAAAPPLDLPEAITRADRIITRAGQLSEQTAERLQKASTHPLPPSQTEKPQAAASEIAVALRLVRQPKTVRQAFIASLVLGPPKALDN